MKEGLRARDIERKWSQGGDGVLDATGEEVMVVLVQTVFWEQNYVA